MRQLAKRFLKRCIDVFVDVFGENAAGRYLFSRIVENVLNRTQSVEYGAVGLVFSTPNGICRYRAESFAEKEPETLEWIDSMPEGSVLWDIGANVGLYTCYAAKARGCRVYAFEPSVFNLEMLAKNVHLNGLTGRVTIVPMALAEERAVSTLNMTTTEWGGALSTFGRSYGHDGQPMQKVFEFSTVGLSMVDAAELLDIPMPNYIKMDVDGIEHLILKGGIPVLRHAKGVLVEINDQFSDQANQASACLEQAGFVLKAKKHAEQADTGMSKYTFNQIWVNGTERGA